ncbi:TraR/DksA family transcriptional regulator [Desulfonatronum parangueonense]
MTHDQLYVFRKALEELLEKVRSKGKLTAESISESFQTCPDLMDRASLESHRQMLIILGQRDGFHARQIAAALHRIDDGCYGICRECSEAIPLNRLKFQPTSTLCVCCQEEMETAARIANHAYA